MRSSAPRRVVHLRSSSQVPLRRYVIILAEIVQQDTQRAAQVSNHEVVESVSCEIYSQRSIAIVVVRESKSFATSVKVGMRLPLCFPKP